MKRLLYIISALMLLASCSEEQPAVEQQQVPLNVSICFETKAGGSGDESTPPVINSVRVLGFNANDAGKPCVLNEFFPFGYTVLDAGNYYKVQLSSPIIINSQSTKYDFYVVLNEGEYQLASQTGDATVSDLLTDITAGSSVEPDFTAIYAELAKNDKTDTSGDPVGEPAFLMCASSLGFEISEAEQKLPDAKDIQFIVPGGRTMAQIIINKITSAPISVANEAAVPLVFVKSVTLENVPSTIDWDEPATTATGATPMASIPVGEAVTDSNGVYYNRVWPGFLYANVAVNAEVTQTTDARMYLGDKSGFLELDQQERNITKFETKDWGKGDNKDAKNAYNSIKADKFKPLFENAADKNYFEVDAENTKSFYSVKQVTQPSLSFGTDSGLTFTDDVWTVNLGEKYYVPENITSNAGDATYIKVVLAVAAPSLELGSIRDSVSWWPTPGEMTRTSNYTCYMPYTGTGSTDGEIAIGSNNAPQINDATAKLVAQANMHIVLADDRDTEVPITTPKQSLRGVMNVYFDGFYRKATGTSTVTVNQNQKGGVFKWNVPSTGLYEFNIPVNNNLDGSYSIKRNTRYKVTLHVNNDPRPTTSSFAGSSVKNGSNANIGITAVVETEKINDYED